MALALALALAPTISPLPPLQAAKLLPSSLIAILLAMFIEYVIVRHIPCPPGTGDDAAHRRALASVGNSSDAGGVMCRTDVIGDVTPFNFT